MARLWKGGDHLCYNSRPLIQKLLINCISLQPSFKHRSLQLAIPSIAAYRIESVVLEGGEAVEDPEESVLVLRHVLR